MCIFCTINLCLLHVPFCAVNVLFHFVIARVPSTNHFVDSFAGPLEKVCISRCPILDSIDHMGVSENYGTPKSSILIGFSIINHPFWGTPIFGNTHIFKGANIEWYLAMLPCSRDWPNKNWLFQELKGGPCARYLELATKEVSQWGWPVGKCVM